MWEFSLGRAHLIDNLIGQISTKIWQAHTHNPVVDVKPQKNQSCESYWCDKGKEKDRFSLAD